MGFDTIEINLVYDIRQSNGLNQMSIYFPNFDLWLILITRLLAYDCYKNTQYLKAFHGVYGEAAQPDADGVHGGGWKGLAVEGGGGEEEA